ncbi:MAG TPA: YraN family protein [Rickettsiales bacterium]|nr:YraN family protein [Rickettsiales bacterium]
MTHDARRKRSYLRGIAAEYWCAGLLLLKGYRIIQLRHRNRYGEIDIIAARRNLLVFTEVKARSAMETALYSVTPTKQQVIARAASAFIAAHEKYSHTDLRFDLMVVTSRFRIYHLENAWSIQ